jgi:DNA-binding transcriptional MerR regulator
MKSSLEGARGRRYIGVSELANQATTVLAEQGTVQGKGTVSDFPDERTVRYYLSEGLISPAVEKQGTASVFGYIHLLQLLAIKKLQSDHIPIRKIREIVGGSNERQLERLLFTGGDAGERNDARRYLESLLVKPSVNESRTSAARPRSAAAPTGAYMRPPEEAEVSAFASEGIAKWERVEVEPGLEMHIRSDYVLNSDQSSLSRIRNLIEKALRLLILNQKQ